MFNCSRFSTDKQQTTQSPRQNSMETWEHIQGPPRPSQIGLLTPMKERSKHCLALWPGSITLAPATNLKHFLQSSDPAFRGCPSSSHCANHLFGTSVQLPLGITSGIHCLPHPKGYPTCAPTTRQ